MSCLLFIGGEFWRILISAIILFSVLIVSGCKEDGAEFYIPTDEMRCIDYTKAAIEKRGENYAEYTDEVMATGEAVWVAGKKFDFDFVRPAAGVFAANFRNEYFRVDRQGRLYPGVSVRMKQDVEGMKRRNPGLIETASDPEVPHIVIVLNCKFGAIPQKEIRLNVERVLPEVVVGNPAEYSVKLNETLGFYEVEHIDNNKGTDVFFIKETNGKVEVSYPRIRCNPEGGGVGGGTCFAKTVPWENIEINYYFPMAQLSDFTRIYEKTMNLISGAYIKGEN